MSTSQARKDAAKRWDQRNPEKLAVIQRNKRLRRVYGMTPAGYKLMLEQNPNCPGCGVEFTDKTGKELSNRSRACIDHIHGTKTVRGLLCCRCNSTIGYAKDNPQTLRNLADYLED